MYGTWEVTEPPHKRTAKDCKQVSVNDADLRASQNEQYHTCHFPAWSCHHGLRASRSEQNYRQVAPVGQIFRPQARNPS